MALYHRYRPQAFEQVVGNEATIASITADLTKTDPPKSFLISGPTGCGKTTLGRIIATQLGCKGGDFREVDSADFRGIDTIRDIRRQSQFMPLEGACRVWLLDECHQLGSAAQPALLKALEDTPPHVRYILATTDPQKLLATIRGRCAQYQVGLLTDREMMGLLRRVVREEGESIQKTVYDQIIQDSQGHARNALQILDSVLAVEPDLRLDVATKAAETQSQSIELCRALINGEGWKKVANILSGLQDQDAESIRRHVLGYCNSVLLKSDNVTAGLVMDEFIEPFYNTGMPGLTFACYSVVKGG